MAHTDDFPPTQILMRPASRPRSFTPPQKPPPPPPPLSALQTEHKAPKPERLSFTGSGGEYFRIWIVNLLLMILTFGIYSAWAKVRKLRYFYDSTHLASSSFEYHGKPIAILKGRVIAAGLLIAYVWAPNISKFAGVAMLVLLAAVMPWLIWKSMQFKLINSSYRGIRFGFDGTWSQAYVNFLVLPFLSGLTMNLLTPFVHQRIKAFQHSESRFGRTSFSFSASVGRFYKVYLIGFLVFVVGAIAIVAMMGGMAAAMRGAKDLRHMNASIILGILVMGAAIYLWGYMVYGVFITMIQNIVWNHTRLGEHDFVSEMKWGRVAFIMFTNVIGIVLTLGLFMPFAKIRMLKYCIESVTMLPASDLDGFVADRQLQVSAAGEGAADLFDIDFAL